MPLDRSPAGCSHTGGLRQDTERGGEGRRVSQASWFVDTLCRHTPSGFEDLHDSLVVA